MSQRALTVSSENRNGRILISFAILAAEIVLKSAVAGAQQTQFVPASVLRIARVASSIQFLPIAVPRALPDILATRSADWFDDTFH